ncbi:MAG TPA: hypothetical protein VML95_03515 [Longimicrobiales bacterium]|nr:hypothetical protein [Longimicrobiales bacterium]
MSANGPEDGAAAGDGWNRLEASVQELLSRHDALLERARSAEGRVAELEGALETARSGVRNAGDLEGEIERVRRRNRLLEERIVDGRTRVRQIAERLRLAQEG